MVKFGAVEPSRRVPFFGSGIDMMGVWEVGGGRCVRACVRVCVCVLWDMGCRGREGRRIQTGGKGVGVELQQEQEQEQTHR